MKNIVFGLCVIVLFAGCFEKEKKELNNEDSTKTVFVTKAKLKDENQNRIFTASASSNHQIKLSFKVQGNLNYFKLQLGDEVKKGQLLARLDSKPYELKVSQASYGLSEAKASLQNAKSNYERVKKLYINQNASASDIDNAKASFEASKAKVKNISKQLEYAKLQLSYTKLYSPIDGYVSTKFVNENENVAVGTPIILLSDKLVDEVRVKVPESIINYLKIKDKVKVSFNSILGKKFDAQVSEISKFTSLNEKNYLVIIKIKNSSNLIKSGMSADVYFDFENLSEEVFLIPSNSVLNDKGGYFVYVVENGLIKRKSIKIGKLTKDGYEILGGLSKNDLILKAGMSEVFENMKVKIGNKKDLEN